METNNVGRGQPTLALEQATLGYHRLKQRNSIHQCSARRVICMNTCVRCIYSAYSAYIVCGANSLHILKVQCLPAHDKL